MEMSRVKYERVLARVDELLRRRDCLKQLVTYFPDSIPRQTLLSIHSQHYQHVTKQTHSLHRKPDAGKAYYERYRRCREEVGEEDKELLLRMADEVHLSPTLFARIIIEQKVLEESAASSSREVVSQWIKDPLSIPDRMLQIQVRHCIVNDTNYGPLAENLKHSLGYEYEFLLQENINQLGIPFLDERSLRGRGYDKTPDFKLEIPIAINGYVINWIESKASFGDDHTHSQYLEDQFWAYQNRFGPGAVLYWMGFISDLNCHREQGILLLSSFPPTKNIQTIKHTMS